MAWNEPPEKKNPWNNDNKDGPPDLDDVFRNIRSKFGGGNRGGQGGSPVKSPFSGAGPIVALVIVGVVVWGAFSAFHIIEQAERGVVLRFGDYSRTLQPGFNVTLPMPIEKVYTVDVEDIRSSEDEAGMLTKDENLVNLSWAVQFRVAEPQKFLFQVEDPIETVDQSAESALRQVIGNNNMDFILKEGRAEISQRTQRLLQAIIDRYQTGIEITVVNLQDVRPPQEVKEAFDDAIKAREDEQRFVNEAEAYSNQVIPEARGMAARIVEEAEGYRESLIARSEGESDRFNQLVAEYQAAPEVTRQRLYLSTMEGVLSRLPKVIIDVPEGNSLMYLPIDQLGQSGRSSSMNVRGDGERQITADPTRRTQSNINPDNPRSRDGRRERGG